MMANDVQADSKKHELEEIDGIGPGIRAALIEGGVQTLADLAGSSGDKIEIIIKPVSYKEIPAPLRTRQKIDQWVLDAKAKVLAQTEWRTYEEFTVLFNYGYSEDGQKLWRALIHPQDDVDKPEPPKWHPDPNDEGYTVQFEFQAGENGQKLWRTLIYNGETLEETDITGWTPDQWWTWIAEKASLTEEALQAAIQDDEGIESMTLPKAVKRQVIEASEDALALKVNGFEHRSSEKRANKLAADVNFSIAGEQADKLLAQWPPLQFQVEVFVVNLENKVSSLVGFVSQNAEPGKVEYTSEIEFAMPELGHYKPHCLVRMLPSGEAAYLEGPSFEVVPKKLGS